jgi:hypothetical protein
VTVRWHGFGEFKMNWWIRSLIAACALVSGVILEVKSRQRNHVYAA